MEGRILSVKIQMNMIWLWVKAICQRCPSIMNGICDWFVVGCRIVVPVCLTIVGSWTDEYCLFLQRLINSKPSEWVMLWNQYDHPGRVLFLLVVIVLIVVQIIFEVIMFRRKRHANVKISDLESKLSAQRKEIEEAKILKDNVSSVLKLYLSAAAKSLKLGADERISFYILNADGKSFSILARVSENADLRAYKRDTFAYDEGIIGLARKTGWAFVNGLPSYKKAKKNYINACKGAFTGLSVARIKALTMKAQLYYAFRFSSYDNMDFNSIVVVESMNPGFANAQVLNDVFNPDNDFVYMLVKNFGKYMSTPDVAKKEDF